MRGVATVKALIALLFIRRLFFHLLIYFALRLTFDVLRLFLSGSKITKCASGDEKDGGKCTGEALSKNAKKEKDDAAAAPAAATDAAATPAAAPAADGETFQLILIC